MQLERVSVSRGSQFKTNFWHWCKTNSTIRKNTYSLCFYNWIVAFYIRVSVPVWPHQEKYVPNSQTPRVQLHKWYVHSWSEHPKSIIGQESNETMTSRKLVFSKGGEQWQHLYCLITDLLKVLYAFCTYSCKWTSLAIKYSCPEHHIIHITSSIALMRFWVDLLISAPAGGIPLLGVKKAEAELLSPSVSML